MSWSLPPSAATAPAVAAAVLPTAAAASAPSADDSWAAWIPARVAAASLASANADTSRTLSASCSSVPATTSGGEVIPAPLPLVVLTCSLLLAFSGVGVAACCIGLLPFRDCHARFHSARAAVSSDKGAPLLRISR